jgi:hypothetical protein
MGQQRPFWNPYVAGVALGLVLLAAFVVAGQGLGASGAANRLGIGAAHVVAPYEVEHNAYMGSYYAGGAGILDDWLVFEVLGVVLGGAIGAYSAGRMRKGIAMGLRPVSPRTRLLLAFAGGLLMAVAARLARGCTSGQALTGGSLLSLGSWVFMMCVFAGGYLVAPLVRRQWR